MNLTLGMWSAHEHDGEIHVLAGMEGSRKTSIILQQARQPYGNYRRHAATDAPESALQRRLHLVGISYVLAVGPRSLRLLGKIDWWIEIATLEASLGAITIGVDVCQTQCSRRIA